MKRGAVLLAAIGTCAGVSTEAASADAAKSIAAFQETLISISTRFDAFRDALARGDLDAAGRYPEDAQRGRPALQHRRHSAPYPASVARMDAAAADATSVRQAA